VSSLQPVPAFQVPPAESQQEASRPGSQPAVPAQQQAWSLVASSRAPQPWQVPLPEE
jgi:hypothetical protein